MPGNTTAANVCAGRKQKNTKNIQVARKKTVEMGGKAPPTSLKPTTSTPLASTTPVASAQVALTSVSFPLKFSSSMARASAARKAYDTRYRRSRRIVQPSNATEGEEGRR